MLAAAGSASASSVDVQGALDKCTSGILAINELEASFYEDGWRRFDSNRRDTLIRSALWPLLAAGAGALPRSSLTENVMDDALHVIEDAFTKRNDGRSRVFVKANRIAQPPTLVIAQAEPSSHWKARFLWCTILSNEYLARPSHYPPQEVSGLGAIKGVNLAGPLTEMPVSTSESAEVFLWATVWFQSNDETTMLDGAELPPYTYIRTQTKYDDAETRDVFSDRLTEMVR